MKKYILTLILTAVIVLAGVATPAQAASRRPPQDSTAGENTTLSITKFEGRGGLALFVVMDATGCIQTAASIGPSLSFEQTLPEPAVSGKLLSVVLNRIDLCAGVALLIAEGSLLNPVLTVAKDLRSASVSAGSIVLSDVVTATDVTAGPIEVTWTAEGQLTAESGIQNRGISDPPFNIVLIGAHKFRIGQAQGSVFFEGLNIAQNGSRFAEIIESKSMTIEIQSVP